jgi:hypothetical protein
VAGVLSAGFGSVPLVGGWYGCAGLAGCNPQTPRPWRPDAEVGMDAHGLRGPGLACEEREEAAERWAGVFGLSALILAAAGQELSVRSG